VHSLPTTYPFTLLNHYPHMQPADVSLWERFVNFTLPQPWTVAYDVHVGSLPELPPDLPEYLRRDAEALYPAKIDVVIYETTETLIVEIKPRASFAAIGQVLSYVQLYRRDFPDGKFLQPCIITDTAHLDTAWLCRIFKITLTELDHLEAQAK